MGWVQGKGSAKAPFHGRDEVVSMKWLPWNGLGSWGQERPPSRWVQGERSLPRVFDRRYGLLVLKWAQRPERATAWGMQRGRAAVPLPRCTKGKISNFVLQYTSCVLWIGSKCTTKTLRESAYSLKLLRHMMAIAVCRRKNSSVVWARF